MYQKSAPNSIQSMFGTIASNYDRANNIFTFGIHKIWNRKLIKLMGPATHLLDLCAGTGEVALEFLRSYPDATATLIDFCPEMLELAEKKGKELKRRFEILQGDVQNISLPSNSFDAATISYGIRNVEDSNRCFREVSRLLRPGGRFGILEATCPSSSLLRSMHRAYLKLALPLFGKMAAKNVHAYKYLASSIESFLSPSELEKQLYAAGLTPLARHSLCGGVATILIAEKRATSPSTERPHDPSTLNKKPL